MAKGVSVVWLSLLVSIDVEKVSVSINWSQATPRRSQAIDFEGLAPGNTSRQHTQAATVKQ